LRSLEAEKERDSRRLPCPIGTQEREGLTPGYLEVDVVQGDYRAVAVHHAGEAQRRATVSVTVARRITTKIHLLIVIGAPGPFLEVSG
jgi:hypothetical protein